MKDNDQNERKDNEETVNMKQQIVQLVQWVTSPTKYINVNQSSILFVQLPECSIPLGKADGNGEGILWQESAKPHNLSEYT